LIERVLCVSFFIAAFAGASVSAATIESQPATAGVSYRSGVIRWERVERRPVAPKTITRFSSALAPGTSKLVAFGAPGVLEVKVLYAQRDGGRVARTILAKTLIRASRPRIVAEGVPSNTLAAFEARGLTHMASIARGAILMLATAYTAASAGGSGMTAIGRRAGYGIVAVDPRVIPLGTPLYITGYGLAIAGDTGGDIVGNRIDLGFDSLRGAMLFGRRAVTVYRLK
jgi:3D (Asp-Asp-Asp) domain-containing protein